MIKVDALSITLTLEESQRVKAPEISGTPGGDGSTATIDIAPNFATDLSFNPLKESRNIILNETADIIIPKVENATINYSNGNLLIYISETIDTTPSSKVNLSKIFISNESYFVPSLGKRSLKGAKIPAVDLTYLNITLPERLRYEAIKYSGSSGGDGQNNKLTILGGPFPTLDLILIMRQSICRCMNSATPKFLKWYPVV